MRYAQGEIRTPVVSGGSHCSNVEVWMCESPGGGLLDLREKWSSQLTVGQRNSGLEFMEKICFSFGKVGQKFTSPNKFKLFQLFTVMPKWKYTMYP